MKGFDASMFEVTAQARWCGKERVPVPIPSSQPTLRAARLRCARGVWDGQTDSNFKVGNQRHGKSNVRVAVRVRCPGRDERGFDVS